MILIAVSSSNRSKSEVSEVIKLFQNGLDFFHVWKPKFSTKQMDQYISMFPPQYHSRIVLHSKYDLAIKYDLKGIHLGKREMRNPIRTWFTLFMLRRKKSNIEISTTHKSLSTLAKDKRNYSYVFFSPVFESISKKGYRSNYSHDQIRQAINQSQTKVIGFGGINVDNIETAISIGFNGIAILGAFWKEGVNTLAVFEQMKAKIEDVNSRVFTNIHVKPVKINVHASTTSQANI